MNNEIENVKIGTDLIDAVNFELKLLYQFDQLNYLHEANAVNEAVRRYETLWLPLMKDYKGVIVAPMDVYWIWHVHMLCPVVYRKDVGQSIGKVLDHKFLTEDQYSSAISSLKSIWKKRFPMENFDASDANTESNFTSLFAYDIKSAALRQSSFFYQVSLPHYQNKSFLERCLVRYRMFLTLKKHHPTQVIVPCYDIDIMWHVHQLHPVIYARDTVALLGYVLPHDDSVNDRSPDSKLSQTDKETRTLWIANFKEGFSNNGSMYRGESTRDRLGQLQDDYLYAMRPKVVELSVNFSTEFTRQCNVILKIFLMTNQKKDLLICSYDYYRKSVSRPCDTFFFSTYDNVGFRIKLFRKVGLCTREMKFITQLSTTQDFDTFTTSSIGSKISYKLEILQNKKVFDIISMNFTPLSISVNETFHGLVILGDFFNVSINMSDSYLWGRTIISKTDDLPAEGIMASHSIQTVSGKYVFDVNIIHFLKLNQSIVQVLCNDKVLTVSHVIGKDQLPSAEEIEIKEKCPMLNHKEGQRAMLLKDNKGDWAIILGNWRVHKTGNLFSECLELKLFQLRDNKLITHFELENLDDMQLIIDDLYVNFFTGHVDLKCCNNISELPNYISLIFSISILYILCKPRLIETMNSNLNIQDSTVTCNNLNLTPEIKVLGRPYSSERKASLITNIKAYAKRDCEFAQLLVAAGHNYKQYIPSNSFFKQCVNSGGCAGCIGSNTEKNVGEPHGYKHMMNGEDSRGENIGCFCSDGENEEESEE